jgi:hypothetical protein
MTRRSTFDRLAAAKVAGGASHGDAPATALRQYANMRIIDVHTDGYVNGDIVLEVGAIGHQSRRRILIEGITRVRDITPTRRDDVDDSHDDDIGDELAERERYAEHDIDIAPAPRDNLLRRW